MGSLHVIVPTLVIITVLIIIYSYLSQRKTAEGFNGEPEDLQPKVDALHNDIKKNYVIDTELAKAVNTNKLETNHGIISNVKAEKATITNATVAPFSLRDKQFVSFEDTAFPSTMIEARRLDTNTGEPTDRYGIGMPNANSIKMYAYEDNPNASVGMSINNKDVLIAKKNGRSYYVDAKGHLSSKDLVLGQQFQLRNNPKDDWLRVSDAQKPSDYKNVAMGKIWVSRNAHIGGNGHFMKDLTVGGKLSVGSDAYIEDAIATQTDGTICIGEACLNKDDMIHIKARKPGPEGPQGERGFDGVQGLTGLKGPEGEMGKEGPPGPDGKRGEKGLRGAMGIPGPVGNRGPEGPMGAMGPAGAPGPLSPAALNPNFIDVKVKGRSVLANVDTETRDGNVFLKLSYANGTSDNIKVQEKAVDSVWVEGDKLVVHYYDGSFQKFQLPQLPSAPPVPGPPGPMGNQGAQGNQDLLSESKVYSRIKANQICVTEQDCFNVVDIIGAFRPVDCQYSTWIPSTKCDKECGGGKQKWVRQITQNAMNGGVACKEPLEKEEACNVQACPPVDCKTEVDLANCKYDCNTNTRICGLKVTQQPMYGGKACPNPLTTSLPMSNDELKQYCKQDCEYDVVNCGQCSKICGAGTQSCTINIKKPAKNGGVACPSEVKRDCNLNQCPIDCEGSWSDWSACSASCGQGTQTRKYNITRQPQYGGKACPADETQACNGLSCSGGTVLWSDTFTKGQAPTSSQANNWRNFVAQLANKNFSSVKVWGSYNNNGVTMTNPSNVNAFARAIVNNQKGFSVTENGYTWAITGVCSNNVSADTIEIQVGDSLVGNCNCTGPDSKKMTIRPLIGNYNWGGIGTETCSAPTQTMNMRFEGGQSANLFNGGPGFSCPTGNKTFTYQGQLSESSSAQALAACEACYGVGNCEHVTGDCAGHGYGKKGAYSGNVAFGYQSGCSGSAGRAWKYGSSYDTYGYWAKGGGGAYWTDTFTKGQTPTQSQVNNWNNFVAQLSNKTFNSVKIWGSANNTSATMTNPNNVNAFARAIVNSQSGFSVSENGYTWGITGVCSVNVVPKNIEIQVGNSLVGNCGCTGPDANKMTIRPLIGNENWGGIGTATCSAPTQTMHLRFD